MNVMSPGPSGRRGAEPGSARQKSAQHEARKHTLQIAETEADLHALRPEWEDLQARDTESGVFLSWEWLSIAFRQNPNRWRVFVVRAGTDCVCIFPVKYRVHWSKSLEELQSEMEAGGRLLWSEYCGFLCDPDREDAALEYLAHEIARLPWVKLSLRYEPTANRAAKFMAAFPRDTFKTQKLKYRINNGKTNNLVSPQVTLPGDFETYLLECLSKSRREKIRREFRRRLDSGELHVTETTGDTFDRDITSLLDFWTAKWAEQKGSTTADRVVGNYRKILAAALEMDILFMPVLWRGDQPLGALAHIADVGSRTVHFIVAGRDADAEDVNIGLLLHAYSIRWSIECGFRIYDFGHGNEDYKYGFGAKDRKLNYFSVRRKSNGQDTGVLDPICLVEAMTRAIEFIDTGKTVEASAACRQILFDCI